MRDTLYGIVPPADALKALSTMLGRRKKRFTWARDAYTEEPDVRGVVWALVHGLRAGVLTESKVLRILDIHLPAHLPDNAGSRLHAARPAGLLLGFALRARLTGDVLRVQDVAGEHLVKLMAREHSGDRSARDFKTNIPGLLPWAECWVAAILDSDSEDVATRFSALASTDLASVSDYDPPFVFINTIADIGIRILELVPQEALIKRFAAWYEAAEVPLVGSRLTIARVTARSPHLEALGLEVVTRGIDTVQGDRTDADTRVEALIDLGRTLLAANQTEARAIFDRCGRS